MSRTWLALCLFTAPLAAAATRISVGGVMGDRALSSVEGDLNQALLGMSFLNRVSMQREGDTLVLM